MKLRWYTEWYINRGVWGASSNHAPKVLQMFDDSTHQWVNINEDDNSIEVKEDLLKIWIKDGVRQSEIDRLNQSIDLLKQRKG